MSHGHDQPRALRRHVRVECTVRSGSQVLVGFSTNISASGIHLHVPADPAMRHDVGARFKLRFRLPNEAWTRAIDTTAEVVWVDANDRDSGGRPVIGLGMRLIEPEAAIVDRIATFVRDFRYTVLVVDDGLAGLHGLEAMLGEEYRVIQRATPDEALGVLEREEVAVLITGLGLQMTGLELLTRLAEWLPLSRVVRIVVSDDAELEVEDIQELVNIGKIFQFLRQPLNAADVTHTVQRAVDTYALLVENERLHADLTRAVERLRRENDQLRRRVLRERGLRPVIGASQSFQRSLEEIDRVRHSEVPVHVSGETGTGKELMARVLHEGGPRAGGPFVAQNCASMPETLLQSTLFGHRKGSFTGADRDHRGVFQEADGGTLFLDEVAELSRSVQASLLRALQDGEIMPVGASRPLKVNVRIVSATNKDLREEVKAGRFREDLFFRIMVISVTLPPLRERDGDVSLLAHYFFDRWCERLEKQVAGFQPEVIGAFEAYRWPGNVRELENEIERLVVLTEDAQKITLEMVSPHIRANGAVGGEKFSGFFVDYGLSYDAARLRLDEMMVEHALRASGGVVSRAADLLGMERSRLSKIRRRLLERSAEVGPRLVRDGDTGS